MERILVKWRLHAVSGRKLLPGLCVTAAVPVLAQDRIIHRTVQIRNYFGQSFVSVFSNTEITTTYLKQTKSSRKGQYPLNLKCGTNPNRARDGGPWGTHTFPQEDKAKYSADKKCQYNRNHTSCPLRLFLPQIMHCPAQPHPFISAAWMLCCISIK